MAFSNGITHAVLIPSRVKVAGFHMLQGAGKTKEEAKLLLFAAGLYLLLESYLDQLKQVVIDLEYTGKERNIKANLLRFIWERVNKFDPEQIVFRRVGKKSPADRKAREVRTGKDRNYRRVSLEEMLSLIVK